MMDKRKCIRYLFRVLAVCWMVLIFSMSARKGTHSTVDSNTVGRLVAQIIVPSFGEISEEEQQIYVDALDYGIRKSAHAAEFAILTFFFFFSFDGGSLIRPWALTVMYAVLDECHQIFVPGRSGQITDVGIDAAGALICVLCIAFGSHLIRHLRKSD